MKKTMLLAAALSMVFAFFNKTNAQHSDVYWFTIKIKSTRYAKTNRFPSAIKSGEIETFERLLYESLKRGFLSIGPFWDYEEAEKARLPYRDPSIKVELDKKQVQKVHWFFIGLDDHIRSRSAKITPLPTRMLSGSMEDFQNSLKLPATL